MKRIYNLAERDGVSLIKKGGLLAPMGYWGLTPYLKSKICNGCGPGKLGYIIPDKLLGIDFTPACDIHDYTYHHPLCSFKLANSLFRHNLKLQVSKSGVSPKWIGYALVNIYVAPVKSIAGRYCYWRAQHA